LLKSLAANDAAGPAGAAHPDADGFNEGWIDFEGLESAALKGRIEARATVAKLINT
jgi:hypothetical protein